MARHGYKEKIKLRFKDRASEALKNKRHLFSPSRPTKQSSLINTSHFYQEILFLQAVGVLILGDRVSCLHLFSEIWWMLIAMTLLLVVSMFILSCVVFYG